MLKVMTGPSLHLNPTTPHKPKDENVKLQLNPNASTPHPAGCMFFCCNFVLRAFLRMGIQVLSQLDCVEV